MAAFPLYGDAGASSRVRLSQFLPALAAAGLNVERSAFFSDDELRARQRGRSTGPAALLRIFARRRRAVRASAAQLYWLEKEFLPWLPFAAERDLLRHARPLVIDIDDAVFHRYDRHPRAVVRALYGDKLDRLFAAADLVTAGNEYLADRAQRAGATRVEVVPSVVPVSAYRCADHAATDTDAFRIVWIGQPSTQHYLDGIRAAFDALASDRGSSLSIIGATRAPSTALPTDLVPWRPGIEFEALASYSVGIMPLADTEWERGKCGYKLLQYMAAGLPVVASAVGANRSIVRHGVDGFLVQSDAEWTAALRQLRHDPALRRTMGAAARARVTAAYASESWGPQLAALLRSASATRAA